MNLYNKDSLEAIKLMSDNQFDLAIVDPPYGIGVGSMSYTNGVERAGNGLAKRKNYYKENDWDLKRPDKEYFDNLIRVSKNQIIWGGNYFADLLTPTKSWIVWDKKIEDKYTNNFADCEMAWASKGVARMIRLMWNGMLQHDMKNKEKRIHPTQKPVKLYEWLLTKYAKEGDKILDTHLGSGSIAIACHNLGYDLTGYEIDKDYFDSAIKRIEEHKNQLRIF